MPLEGLQLGRYRLLSVLGSGGMGEVYLGEDTHIHRQVAIKVIRTEPSSYPDTNAIRESERLFRREIRAIATLDHPHILPLFDYGEETIHTIAYTYMVMPLRKEGSLAQWLRQNNTTHLLSPQQIVHLINQAASALSYAHKHQIIHQDVKPSNFLIRSNEEQPDLPDLSLADFGIAKFHTSTASVSQTSRGTPAYMAPEQWLGQPVPATDQYALAIMTYQLLLGNPPFQGRQEQVMYQHFNVQPQPPSKLNSVLPADLDAVLLHALAKKPEERFASISAFAYALRQALQSKTTPAIKQTQYAIPETPQLPESNELRVTLAISEDEAAAGTIRTLTLPGGRKIALTVPANIASGHIIQLKDQDAGREQTLTVTIAIKRAEDERPTTSQTGRAEEKTYLSDRPQVKSTNVPGTSQINRSLTSRVRGFPRNRTILIVGLVLLVLLGSVGTFYFRNFNYIHRASLLNEIIKNPYAPPDGTVALNDPLTDNSNGYFWGEGSDVRGNCNFIDGSYHIIIPGTNYIHYCFAENTSFSNFTYQVQITILKGNCGGIISRVDSDNLNFYYFFICQSGSSGLSSYKNNKVSQQLWNSNQTSNNGSPVPVHQGLNASNTIAVTTNNNSITLYINQQKITQINDSSYSQGQIGVTAESLGDPTEVKFSNAQVWTF